MGIPSYNQPYYDIIHRYNQNLYNAKLFRTFDCIDKTLEPPYALVNGKKCVIWCSNDYLSFTKNNKIMQSAIDGISKYGLGSGGTRNITGNSSEHIDVEQRIASFHSKSSAILYNSAYMANVGFIWGIVKIIPDITIFSDQKNHASIIHGIRVSRANKIIFNHNDISDLQSKIEENDTQFKLIIVESIYSMSGNIAHIAELIEIAKKYGAMLYVDEVHAVGLYSHRGAGIVDKLGMNNEIWAINGTFNKAFGSIGGYVACDIETANAVKNASSPFIFTTSLPASLCRATVSAIDCIEKSHALRNRLMQNVRIFIETLKKHDIEYEYHGSHIVIINIYDEGRSDYIASELLLEGIYIRNIKYPTVPKHQALLRICPNPYHTQDHIVHLAQCLKILLVSQK